MWHETMGRNWFLACSVSLTLLAGCGGGPSRPPTYPVEGTVTLDGKPLPDATVTFRPAGTDSGQRPANGKTDADGRYQLTTFSAGDGAMAGSYRVAIMKFAAVDSAAIAADGDDYVPPRGPLPTPKNELPKKFADADQSGLTATVEATAEGEIIDFKLGD